MMIIKIPRVCVYIPGETSRIKFVPEYEYPIFQKLYRGRIQDPAGDPLRIIRHPDDAVHAMYWYEVEADGLEEAILFEAARLREAFGTDAKSGDTVFDTVYPSTFFDEALTKAVSDGEKFLADPKRQDPETGIMALCTQVGVDRRTARKMADVGWRDAESLAGADVAQLSKLVGRVRAAHFIKLAEKELGLLIDATPAEIISHAKAAKK